MTYSVSACVYMIVHIVQTRVGWIVARNCCSQLCNVNLQYSGKGPTRVHDVTVTSLCICGLPYGKQISRDNIYFVGFTYLSHTVRTLATKNVLINYFTHTILRHVAVVFQLLRKWDACCKSWLHSTMASCFSNWRALLAVCWKDPPHHMLL